MSERDMSDIYLDTLENMNPGEAVRNAIRNIRAEKSISRDPRLLSALQEAEASNTPSAVDDLSDVCAVLAEEHDVSPELMSRAINAGRAALYGKN